MGKELPGLKEDFSFKLHKILSANSIEKLFNNVRTQVESYDIEGNRIIATVTNQKVKGNCYIVSPYALIISYSKVELHKMKNPILIVLIRILISIFTLVLTLLRIDKIQILNNYLLSTNFFSEHWKDIDSTNLLAVAISRHPDHAIGIRSVNTTQNPELLLNLTKAGWLPLVTRQVYIFSSFDFTKRDVLRDLELLKSDRYVFVKPDANNLEHFEIAERLYNQLYLGKYTEENIQYTAFYIQELYRNNLLHLALLHDTQEDTFVGVAGLMGDETTVTAPIVGYELDIPVKEALYRRCLIYIIKYAHDNKLLLNLSSGAPGFKVNRGAVPEIEYMMVYVQHLSFGRRMIWELLSKISLYLYKPILQTYKL